VVQCWAENIPVLSHVLALAVAVAERPKSPTNTEVVVGVVSHPCQVREGVFWLQQNPRSLEADYIRLLLLRYGTIAAAGSLPGSVAGGFVTAVRQ
jgi:hypothetical protein